MKQRTLALAGLLQAVQLVRKAAEARAAQYVAEAETELLRSAGGGAREPYRRIAAAVGSGKVLLRSA